MSDVSLQYVRQGSGRCHHDERCVRVAGLGEAGSTGEAGGSSRQQAGSAPVQEFRQRSATGQGPRLQRQVRHQETPSPNKVRPTTHTTHLSKKWRSELETNDWSREKRKGKTCWRSSRAPVQEETHKHFDSEQRQTRRCTHKHFDSEQRQTRRCTHTLWQWTKTNTKVYTQTLWQWTETNKKDIKAHQCMLFLCCSAKRQNQCKSDSRLILLMRQVLLLHSRCTNTSMASMDMILLIRQVPLLHSRCTNTDMASVDTWSSWLDKSHSFIAGAQTPAWPQWTEAQAHWHPGHGRNWSSPAVSLASGKALRTPSSMLFHTWPIYKQNKLWKALRTASGMLFHTWTIYKQSKLQKALRTLSGILFHTWTIYKQTGESFEDSKWYVVPYLNNLQTKQTAEQSTNKTNCGKLWGHWVACCSIPEQSTNKTNWGKLWGHRVACCSIPEQSTNKTNCGKLWGHWVACCSIPEHRTVHKPTNRVAHLSCQALAEELFPLHGKWSWVLKPKCPWTNSPALSWHWRKHLWPSAVDPGHVCFIFRSYDRRRDHSGSYSDQRDRDHRRDYDRYDRDYHDRYRHHDRPRDQRWVRFTSDVVSVAWCSFSMKIIHPQPYAFFV